MKNLAAIGISAILVISLSGLAGCGTPSSLMVGMHYAHPSWAPPYASGVRYYYLPDIEVYYDLSDQEFIYLDNGQWLFSPVLPSMYSGFDLYNGFVIALNLDVFQPWMHHQYYVSHYPRYYYHNYYHADLASIRGFNERDRKPIYWRQEERDRINDLKRNERPEKKIEIFRPPQAPHYYGRNIGQPVKVRPQMKESKITRKFR